MRRPTNTHILWTSGLVALAVLLALGYVRATQRVAQNNDAARYTGGSQQGGVPSNAASSTYPGGVSGATQAQDVYAGTHSVGGGTPRPDSTSPASRPSLLARVASSIADTFDAATNAVVDIFVPSNNPAGTGGDTATSQSGPAHYSDAVTYGDVASFNGTYTDATAFYTQGGTSVAGIDVYTGPISTLAGTITSVASGSVMVESVAPGRAPRTVTISADSSASVYQLVVKDAATFDAERAAATAAGTEPPSPYVSQSVSFSALQPGMAIIAHLTAGATAGDAAVHATSIDILPTQ